MAQRRARSRLLQAFSALLCLAVLGGLTPAVAATGKPQLEDRLAADLERLAPSAGYGALVHFEGGTEADHRRAMAEHGLSVGSEFDAIDVYWATATVADFISASVDGRIAYLQSNRELTFYGETANWATRARAAYEHALGGPYLDDQGNPVDGSGVGVAVIDSGINATIPDLEWGSKVATNQKVVCATPILVNSQTRLCAAYAMVDVPNSDTASGHGTHVAGIVAGDGAASVGTEDDGRVANGTFTGTAPGATLHGYGTGEAIFVLYALEAFDDIYDNFDSFSPRIRVINNSWGDDAGTAYNPNDAINKFVNKLVAEKDVTVTFAASNDGGTGAADMTSSYCKNPTPGVICVANYDDLATGTREGTLDGDGSAAGDSSRGLKGQPATYPDVSAPGAFITSPCVRQVQPICNFGYIDEVRFAPFYSTISGTSMASPHVAGVAALLYQARPSITPAEVEDILLDTAYQYAYNTGAGQGPYEADPQNPDGVTSYDKGAGLVDVPAALDALGVAKTGTTVGESRTIFSGDAGDVAAADIDSLSVREEANGMRYSLTIGTDADPLVTEYRLIQTVDAVEKVTSIRFDGVTASPLTAAAVTAPASEASYADGVIKFLVPFANLGNPGPNSPAYNAHMFSYQGGFHDYAPGTVAPVHAITHPEYGAPYTIHPESGSPNTAPIATNDSVSLNQGSSATIDVLANDTDADGDALAVLSTTEPASGALSLTGGIATYTPAAAFHGADSFTYIVSDGKGGTDEGLVTIDVNGRPVATDDSAATNQGTAVTFSAIANDSDPEGDVFSITDTTTPAHGTVAVGPSGITYTPEAGFHGIDSFEYEITDADGASDTGVVTVDVNGTPLATDDTATTKKKTAVRINVLGNDSDPEGNALAVSSATQGAHGSVDCSPSGTCTYIPSGDYKGPDTFTYTVCDARGACDQGAVQITVR